MGGGFVPRTDAEKRTIPAIADAAVALVAGAVAATAVAPFLMCVDRGVVSAAAGTAPGGSLFGAIGVAASEFVTKPKMAFTSPALWMVAGVYAGTYFAKNVSDVVIERLGLSDPVAGLGKFTTVTATNMSGSIIKDAAFAKLFGVAVAASAVAPVVPKASYALFAVRDCLTIGGAFFVPDAMRDALTASGAMSGGAAGAVSQLVSPPLMQVLCTPMHLLALNLVNAPGATTAARLATLKAATPAALLARSLRMLPAYGVGGILNGDLTLKGRAAAAEHFSLRASASASAAASAGALSRRRGGRASDKLASTTMSMRVWGSRVTELVLGGEDGGGDGGGGGGGGGGTGAGAGADVAVARGKRFTPPRRRRFQRPLRGGGGVDDDDGASSSSSSSSSQKRRRRGWGAHSAAATFTTRTASAF